MKYHILLIVLLAPFAVVAAPTDDVPGSGHLILKPKEGTESFRALLMDTEAEVDVTAMTTKVLLRQTFKNTTANWVDGVYVFPMPEQAAVFDLTLKVGERVIKGEINERGQAKKAYEKAKAEGKRAALLESERPNLFTVSIANIEPDGVVTAEITYLDTVTYRDGVFSLRLPTTLTPRYIPGRPLLDDDQLEAKYQPKSNGTGWAVNTDQVPDASRITPPQHRKETENRLRIHATLHPGLKLNQIASGSHEIDWHAQGDTYEVTLKNGSESMDRDFILSWIPDPKDQPSAALFTEEVNGELFATLMMMPPQRSQSETLPRELIFSVDSSGSMAGASMRQAKASLVEALSRLSDTDYFNIIDFDDEAKPLFKKTVAADNARLIEAKEFVNQLAAEGGTNMLPAIDKALVGSPPEGYLRQVVFITDGSVGNEMELFNLIDKKLKKTRLFTVGIGSAPNSYFMRKAAQFGRGSFTYIGNLNDVQQKMVALFRQLESPILQDIRIDWPDGANAEYFPNPLPDLYLGEPLIISARIQPVEGDISIHGRVSGAQWKRQLVLSKPSGQSGLATLWARRKVDQLMDSIVTGTSEETVRPQVTQLAIEHRLATRYTSFVAIDKTPVRPKHKSGSEHQVPNRMPAGNTMALPFPGTATRADLSFLLGALLCTVGLLYLFLPIRFNEKA